MSTPNSSNTLGENFSVNYRINYNAAFQLIGGCPLEWLERGGYAQSSNRPISAQAADSECVHGRLAGDACPSPAVSKRQACGAPLVQNWPHDVPCTCWGGK